jgi:predicted transcriptional regulator of viral defense system
MSSFTGHNAHKRFIESPSADELYAVAEDQAGYFTTAQASQAGYSRSLLSHHVKSGKFVRPRPGVYRLARFPGSPNEDLYVAWLEAGPRAVLSHESALALYDLSDVLPSEIHLILPRNSSRRRPRIRMHTGALCSEDVTTRDGIPVTTVARTIADVAQAGLAEDLVDQAIAEALQRGLVTDERLREQAGRSRARARSAILGVLERGTEP